MPSVDKLNLGQVKWGLDEKKIPEVPIEVLKVNIFGGIFKKSIAAQKQSSIADL